jgi:hypothetical protein
MTLPIIPGTVRCAVSGLLANGQTWTNVIHCRYTGGASSPGDGDLTALDALLVRLYSGTPFGSGVGWLTRCTPSVSLTKISYVRLDATSLGMDIGRTLPGTGAANNLPPECAPVLTIRTAVRGRAHRGRIYLPAPNSVSIDTGGKLTTSVANGMTAQFNGLITALGGPTVAPFWEIGVASYLLRVFTPSTQATMDLDVDVQRRRKK